VVAPKAAQSGSKDAQVVPKAAQSCAKGGQVVPKWCPNGGQVVPEAAQSGSENLFWALLLENFRLGWDLSLGKGTAALDIWPGGLREAH